MNLTALTIHEASDKLRRREFSSVELTAAVFERIAATDAASRRIHDSYQAFRRMLGAPATA